MQTIWKYNLKQTNFQEIEIPVNAKILDIQTQHGGPCIWVLVNTESEKEKRCFEIFGTGHEMHQDMGIDRKYIGTFQLYDGDLVFHLFERIN